MLMVIRDALLPVSKRFLTDDEYRDYFYVLGNTRGAIAQEIAEMAGDGTMRILDIASGHGLFAMELARAVPSASICATGLRVDKKTFLDTRLLLARSGLRCLPHLTNDSTEKIQYVVSDMTTLPFRDDSFDAAANFLGLEDIRMTRKDGGVRRTISEAARVTKRRGIVEFAVQVFGDSPCDILSKEIMEKIGHGAIFLGPAIYKAMMEVAGLKVVAEKEHSTGCILAAKQAMEELRFSCQETSKVYGYYGVRTRQFEEIWEEFGDRIETHGYALYTDMLAIYSMKE